MSFEQHTTEFEGFRTRYVTAGRGPTVVLLHAGGESASDWQWTISTLAETYRVYAPDLHGLGEKIHPGNKYTSDFLARFVTHFLKSLTSGRAALVGNSLGGLIAIRVALTNPTHVAALALVDSAGLGREISPFLPVSALPGFAELAVALCMTPPGAFHRALLMAPLLFSQLHRVPQKWLMDQYMMAQTSYFLAANLCSLRSQLAAWAQREVILDELPRLEMPTLVIWGEHDMMIPIAHAHNAMERLRYGHLAVVPGCGHIPQVEQPEKFASALKAFLSEHARFNGA